MTLSHARRDEIRRVVHAELTNLRIRLLRDFSYPTSSRIDTAIALAEHPIVESVIGALIVSAPSGRKARR